MISDFEVVCELCAEVVDEFSRHRKDWSLGQKLSDSSFCAVQWKKGYEVEM